MASEGKQRKAGNDRRGGGRADVAEQLAWERRTRSRLAIPALLGGVLYLLSTIVINSTLSGAPTVGLLQGLRPAIAKGIAEPSVSPRAAEVVFVSHHVFPLILGSAFSSLALIALTGALLLLARGARFRRPESMRSTVTLVLAGGIGFAVVGIGHQIAAAVMTHQFATGHDFTAKSVEATLTQGTANLIAEYISMIAGIALTVGMFAACLNSMRVGLLPRWMGVVGMLSAVLIFLPIGGATLEVVPAFWLVALGVLYLGRWPSGDPPAWAAGQARPWPTAADRAGAQQGGGKGAGAKPGSDALAAAAEAELVAAGSRNGDSTDTDADAGATVAPSPPRGQSGARRRRKRSSRR